MQDKRYDYSRVDKAAVLSKRKRPNVKSTAFKALTAGISLGGRGRERNVVRSVNLEGDTRSETAGVENWSSRTKVTHSHSEHIAHAAVCDASKTLLLPCTRLAYSLEGHLLNLC